MHSPPSGELSWKRPSPYLQNGWNAREKHGSERRPLDVQVRSRSDQRCARDRANLSVSLLYPVRVHENLAGFSCFQALHAFGEIFHRDAVGDHGMKIELAGFEERGHLIPGLVHAAAVDALNRDAFEDDVFGEI